MRDGRGRQTLVQTRERERRERTAVVTATQLARQRGSAWVVRQTSLVLSTTLSRSVGGDRDSACSSPLHSLPLNSSIPRMAVLITAPLAAKYRLHFPGEDTESEGERGSLCIPGSLPDLPGCLVRGSEERAVRQSLGRRHADTHST